MQKKRSNRGRYRKQKKKKNIIILITCALIISSAVIGTKLVLKQNKGNVQVTTKPNEETNSQDKEVEGSSEDKEVTGNSEEVEGNIVDNSGYLSFEEDPNADDAAMVAENTKGLLNGTKHYPVRTDGKKVVYLTFDDGPSTTNTPEILDVLDRYNVKATFFILGKSIEGNEEAKNILKETAKRGHAIANHTYSHDYSYLYPNRTMNVDNIVSDIEKNNSIMKEVLGEDFSTRVIRFPGGYWSWEGRTAMKEAMEQNGYYNVDWNALNKDAEGKQKNADELLQSTKETVEALGPDADSIVLLMHDTYGKEETVKALPQIIEYFQEKGFEFRTIK